MRIPRSGRRPGRHDTKAEILAAARLCFSETGYDRTTIRQVAARAGIDAAHWVIRRTGRIPALVGCWTLGLAVLSLVLLPASGFWLALGVGILALVAARRDERA